MDQDENYTVLKTIGSLVCVYIVYNLLNKLYTVDLIDV